MGAIKRYFEDGAVYFVTTVTFFRRKIFNNSDHARFLLFSIGYHRYLLDFKLFGYVIMPDHIHMLIQPKSELQSISKIMQHIKGNFARKYNEMVDRHLSAGLRDANGKGKRRYSPVWQEGFYDTGLRDEIAFHKWLEYMHNNPIKTGLAAEAGMYEFSSYNQYHLGHRSSIQIPIDRA
ncbi:MAG: transposase [Elusimicrobiota bacterium]